MRCFFKKLSNGKCNGQMYKNVTNTLKILIHFIYGCMLSFFHFLWCFECFFFFFSNTYVGYGCMHVKKTSYY